MSTETDALAIANNLLDETKLIRRDELTVLATAHIKAVSWVPVSNPPEEEGWYLVTVKNRGRWEQPYFAKYFTDERGWNKRVEIWFHVPLPPQNTGD